MRQQLKLLVSSWCGYRRAIGHRVSTRHGLRGHLRRLVYISVPSLTFWGFPPVIGLAVFKYRLYDIDIVIRKTLLYAVLTVCWRWFTLAA